jgi:hypothetical protein
MNFRAVGYEPILDDLTAALGRFTFGVVVSGHVKPLDAEARRHEILLTRAGIYVHDSYDFEGWQPLGFWNVQAMDASILNVFAGEYVDNATFRQWRKQHAHGGDYLIFSDYRQIPINPPARAEL